MDDTPQNPFAMQPPPSFATEPEAPPKRGRGRKPAPSRHEAAVAAATSRRAPPARAGRKPRAAKATRETAYAPTERALAVIAELGIKPDDVAVLSEAMTLVGRAPKKARARVAAALARIFA